MMEPAKIGCATTRKGGVVAAVNHLKSQHAIEADRARHVVGGEGDGTDAFDHRPSSHQRGARSPGLGGNRSVGMTQIAALVAPPHVVDHGIRPLALHLEGSDQRILRRPRHALVFASDVYADGEFEHHGGSSWQRQGDVVPGSVSSSCENRTCRISLVVTLPLPFFSTRTSCCASGRPAGMTIFPPAFN